MLMVMSLISSLFARGVSGEFMCVKREFKSGRTWCFWLCVVRNPAQD